MKMRNMAVILCFAIVLGGGLPFLRADEPKPEAAVYNVFSDEDELILGSQVSAQKDRDLPLLGPGAIESYVDSVGQAIARKSLRPKLQYRFKVINTATINAFSIPGGYIYFYRGLLMETQNEDEVASVLGHEVGHVVGRHVLNHLSRFERVQQLIQLARSTGVVNDQIIAQVVELVGGPAMLVDLAFSREEESDADLFGAYNCVRAGWDPNGALAMFELFKKFTGDPTLMKRLLDNHPLPQDRIVTVQYEINHMKLPSGLRKNSPEFDAMKAALNRLGPPMPEPKKK
jgi:predicted Zn-dependent protease